MRIQVLLHALDRTGPPMLARSFLGWLRDEHPEYSAQIVSFRGGPMLGEFAAIGPTHVLLDPREPWDHRQPSPSQSERVRVRASRAGSSDVTLAISVAAGQVVTHLGEPSSPLVTWSVERGEDLHWLDELPELRSYTSRWLAGSAGTAAELADRLDQREIHLVAEFVEEPQVLEDPPLRNHRTSLGMPEDPDEEDLLVVGAGIATHRKAPDLFLETALHVLRRTQRNDRFVWIGGEDDPMFPRILAEADTSAVTNLRMLGDVGDVVPWVAAADAFLHTARLDAFPLVCLHAALQGTPVVTWSGCTGAEEMFGDTRLAAEYPDIGGLATLLDGIRARGARADVASAQRHHVLTRFTTRAACPTLLEHLEIAASEATA